MYTLKEFEELFFTKGMTRQWGRDEWHRRFNDPAKRWKTDVDPDCKLPRVQAYANSKEMDGSEKFTSDTVELMTTQARNPKRKTVEGLVAELGTEMSTESNLDLLKDGNLAGLYMDFSERTEQAKDFGAKAFMSQVYQGQVAQGKQPDMLSPAAKGSASLDPAIEAEGVDPSPGKKQKVWDRETAVYGCKDRMLKMCLKLRSSLEEAVNEVRSADVECASRIPENNSVFGPRWETLRCRAECLYAIVGSPQEVETYKDRVRKATSGTGEDSSVKATDPPPGLRYPCDMSLFEELSSIKDLELSAKEAGEQRHEPSRVEVGHGGVAS